MGGDEDQVPPGQQGAGHGDPPLQQGGPGIRSASTPYVPGSFVPPGPGVLLGNMRPPTPGPVDPGTSTRPRGPVPPPPNYPPSTRSDESRDGLGTGRSLGTSSNSHQKKKIYPSSALFRSANSWDFRDRKRYNSDTSSDSEDETTTSRSSLVDQMSQRTRNRDESPGGLDFSQLQRPKRETNGPTVYFNPASNPSTTYKKQIDNDEKLNKLAETNAILVKSIISGQDVTPEMRVQLANTLTWLENANRNDSNSIEERKKIYKSSKKLKRVRQDELLVPDEKENYKYPLPMKEIKVFVGVIDENLNQSIKDYFGKLFMWGMEEGNRYSHRNYKLIMLATMKGEMYRQFLRMQERPLQEIVDWFMKVYHRNTTFASCEEDLINFKRLAGEEIDCTMYRYLLSASEADKYLPRNEKYFTTEMHCLQVLERALRNPAYQDYIVWRDEQLEWGFEFEISECIKEAKRLERKFKCVPKSDIPLPTRVFHERESREGDLTVNAVEPDIEAYPAIKGRGKFQRPGPYSRNSGPYDKNPGTYNGNSNSSNKNQGPVGPMDPNKASSARAPYYTGRKEKEELRANLATDMKPRNKDKYNKFRKDWKKKENKKPWNKPEGNRQPKNYQNSPQYSGNYRSRFPPREQGYNNKNGYRGKPDYRGKNIRKGLYCRKCGIMDDIEVSRKIGCDHTTQDCPNYKTLNPNHCPNCITKGLRANHWLRDCLNINPKESNFVEAENSE